MKKRVQVMSLLSILIINNIKAQYNETIRTGRPGQAIGSFTVGKNILQFQQGIDYNGEINNPINPTSIVSNNVLRFGITEIIEVSALIDY